MKKHIGHAAVLSASLALIACGGGGGGEEAAPASATPSTSSTTTVAVAPTTGAVSAPFVAGASPGYSVITAGANSLGPLANFTQEASGAVTVINNNSLTGTTAVRDIAGDASFAMGRWAAGTQTMGSNPPSTLVEGGRSSTHYVLLTRPASFPASGSTVCDSGNFTAPSWTGTGSVAAADYLGKTTGSATLSFGATGANVSVTLTTQAGAGTQTRTFTAEVGSPSRSAFTGSIGVPNASNTGVQVGSAAGDGHAIVGQYTMGLSNGASYVGVYRFVCK